MHVLAQQNQPPTPEVTHETPPANTAPFDPANVVTVQGTVRDLVSGEPLPRVLVQTGGESGEAALTDGNGHFEIGGVPPGPNMFQLTRPGFRDTVSGLEHYAVDLSEPVETHGVFVLAGMHDLAFAMKPTNAIRGQIDLSTSETAQGISVMLLHRVVQDGRSVWRPLANTRTNADGMYRFAGLEDGDYAVYTEPSMEADIPVALVEPGGEKNFVRNGFATTYYPDARDFSTAGRIHVRGGDTAQANIHLVMEPFHFVRALVVRSTSAREAGAAEGNFNAGVNDAQGHQLPYQALYDAATHSVQAVLPDGSYTLRVALGRAGAPGAFATAARNFRGESGQIDVTVQGRNLTGLRIPLLPDVASTTQVNLTRTSTQSNAAPQPQNVFVMINQADGISDGMVAQFAEGRVPGVLQGAPTAPGAYWVHVSVVPGLCESSFTAGGANLAREPLVVPASGSIAPLTLNLRDDCASLKLLMPPTLPALPTGEESSLTAYIVPDFDSTTDVTPVTLRPSSGGSALMQNLTPGSYHVYTFPAPVALEYRNRDVLAALPSQQVTLDSGTTATLVLEAPAQ